MNKRRLNNMELKTRYIPVAIKKQIVNQIIANCITEENGLITYDYFNYQLALDISLVNFYYNEDVPDMDKFYEEGKMTELYKLIPDSEFDFITNAVAIAIQEKKEINNSISGVIAKGFAAIANKIPEEKAIKRILKEIAKTFNNLNKENLEAIGIEGFIQEIKNKYITSALGGKKE